MRVSTFLALLPLAVASPVVQRSEPAPLYTRDAPSHLSDHYIVKFKKGSVMSKVQDALQQVTAEPSHRFEHIFQGFAGKIDKNTVELLRFLPDVNIPRIPITVIDICSNSHARLTILSRMVLVQVPDILLRAAPLGVLVVLLTAREAVLTMSTIHLPERAFVLMSLTAVLTRIIRYNLLLTSTPFYSY